MAAAPPRPYAALGVSELKALARDAGVNTKGFLEKGDYVAALEAAEAAAVTKTASSPAKAVVARSASAASGGSPGWSPMRRAMQRPATEEYKAKVAAERAAREKAMAEKVARVAERKAKAEERKAKADEPKTSKAKKKTKKASTKTKAPEFSMATPVKELRAAAQDAGIDVTGFREKQEYVAALLAAKATKVTKTRTGGKPPAARYLECTEGTSNKFYRIEFGPAAHQFRVEFGAINGTVNLDPKVADFYTGEKGRKARHTVVDLPSGVSVYELEDAAACIKATDKLVSQKLKKGYVEVGAASRPAPAPEAAAKPPKATPKATPKAPPKATPAKAAAEPSKATPAKRPAPEAPAEVPGGDVGSAPVVYPLKVGESTQVTGSTGDIHTMKNVDNVVFSCTCGAWRFQGGGAVRTCKHLRALLGEEADARRMREGLGASDGDADAPPPGGAPGGTGLESSDEEEDEEAAAGDGGKRKGEAAGAEDAEGTAPRKRAKAAILEEDD